jgi:hypothetical protein
MLETLFLLSIQEIIPSGFEYWVKEIFMLDEIELKKSCECYKKRITSEETELPFYMYTVKWNMWLLENIGKW